VNVPELLARVGEWLAVVELDADGRVAVRECSDYHVPPELLDECREHKTELGACRAKPLQEIDSPPPPL